MDHPEGGYATSRGMMEMLSSGHAWVCWVTGALQSEHAVDGSTIMKAKFKVRRLSATPANFWHGKDTKIYESFKATKRKRQLY